jgi:hypothetical protein
MTPAGATSHLQAVEPLPVVRLTTTDPERFDEMMEAVARVASSGAFTLCEEVEAFESEFAAYNETAHSVGLSSGTDALTLALRALDIGPGDEVIVPANSFIATAEAVSLVGATPQPIDVDADSRLMTAAGVAAAGGALRRAVRGRPQWRSSPVAAGGRDSSASEVIASWPRAASSSTVVASSAERA